MNIYETTTGNDPFQSYVINVNMDFVDNSQKTSYSCTNMTSEEFLSNILTWGCIEPGTNITFTKIDQDYLKKSLTRKIDFDKKIQWLS